MVSFREGLSNTDEATSPHDPSAPKDMCDIAILWVRLYPQAAAARLALWKVVIIGRARRFMDPAR